MRRSLARLALLAAIALSVGQAGSLGGTVARAQSGPGEACALLTTDEISQAVGEPMSQSQGVPEQCIYSSDQGTAFQLMINVPEADDATPLIDRRRARSPDVTDLQIGGFPALFEIGPLLGVPSIYAYPEPAVEVQLDLVTTRDVDARSVLTVLAGLALPRLVEARAEALPTLTPVPSAIAGTADGVCGLLTPEEVSAALGETVTATAPAPSVCLYAGDLDGGSLTGMTVAVARGDEATAFVDHARTLSPTEIEVGGVPALQIPTERLDTGLVRSMVVVMPGTTGLLMSADAPQVIDIAAAVLGLAELAVPRLDSIVLASAAPGTPGPSGPAPSLAAQAGLAGSFPTEIGGSPMTVTVLTGPEFLSQVIGFKPMEQQVTRALRRQDLRSRDLSFAQGDTESGAAGVLALRVEGGRIRPMVSVLLEALRMDRTGDDPRPEDVAGKEGVFEVLSGTQGYAYAKGDTLWIVFAFGQDLTEVFEKLP